ncbi:M4 family metallopeptidase [Flavobacterium sp. 3HN19-14]|uniref:M4 family metallopeptidase n=1 Tax=Flavobacterium sp. 3HN19-14 TaxID=3448133 RepID=UPI003EE1C531
MNIITKSTFFAALLSITAYGQKQRPVYQVNQIQKPNLHATAIPVVSQNKKAPKPKFRITNGSFSHNITIENLSVEAAKSKFNNWFALPDDYTFDKIQERTDEMGITHTNFRQRYKGIAIEAGLIMLHSKNNLVQTINGKIAEFDSLNIQADVTGENAVEIAKNHLHVTALLRNYPVETLISKIENNKDSEWKLIRKVRIDSKLPFAMCNIYVDAVSGKVLKKVNLMADIDTPSTANTVYSGTKPITTDSFQGHFRLRENTRKIETYSATNATFEEDGFVGYEDYTNATSNWSTVNPALDVHWGMEKTYEFYKTTLNRDSFDNAGSTIKNFVDGTMQIANTQNNAFALPPPYSSMVYGLGDGNFLCPVVGLDVEGHEYTHMVVDFNGNGGLEYVGESGALNESFADIFGTCVEFYSGYNPDCNHW